MSVGVYLRTLAAWMQDFLFHDNWFGLGCPLWGTATFSQFIVEPGAAHVYVTRPSAAWAAKVPNVPAY